MLYNILTAYLFCISVVAVVVTIWDKICAMTGRWRIPEKTLLIISVLGGSVAMYVTMQVIRHKTQKPKFMLGIPAIIVVQLIVAYLIREYI